MSRAFIFLPCTFSTPFKFSSKNQILLVIRKPNSRCLSKQRNSLTGEQESKNSSAFVLFATGSLCSPELVVLLPQPSQCWDLLEFRGFYSLDIIHGDKPSAIPSLLLSSMQVSEGRNSL